MLGTLALLTAGHCQCESCCIVYKLALGTTFRRWQLYHETSRHEPWDDDLSEADLEVLAGAGWTAADVRKHVETLQAMVAALASNRAPLPHPGGETPA